MKNSKRAAWFTVAALMVITRIASGQGTLQVAGKDYKLNHAVAYTTKFFDSDATVVLLCSKPIPMDKLKKALKSDDDNFSLPGPKVKLAFEPSGELMSVFAWADNKSISVSGKAEGAKVAASFAHERAHGKVTIKSDKCQLDVSFDTPILKSHADAD